MRAASVIYIEIPYHYISMVFKEFDTAGKAPTDFGWNPTGIRSRARVRIPLGFQMESMRGTYVTP